MSPYPRRAGRPAAGRAVEEAGHESPPSDEALLSARVRGLFRQLDVEAGTTEAAARAGSEADPRARVLGDFRLLGEIGSGGMATVYEAEQVSLHRRVALKVLAPHLSLSPSSVRKFQREAEAGGRPVHPGIVAVHAFGEAGGIHYIAEELVEGGRTLADAIAAHRSGADPPRGWFRRVSEMLAEVADALAHAHACDVIHRDVKPSNVLLTPAGRPKLGDFGLARIEDALALSRSGDLAGTPYYMSPEQALGKRSGIDHRTDVYSLGVTLYECLTLRRPFGGRNTEEVLSAILLRDPPDPRRIDARVPRDLAAVCMKAMEKDPRRRYATMRELAEELRRFHAGEGVRAEPVGALGRSARWLSRRKLQAAGTAVAILVILALVVLSVLLAAQHNERLLAAETRFVPLREALWLDRPGAGTKPDKWHAQVDPGHPDGPMLAALAALAGGELEPAAVALERCLELCASSGDAVLARDARFLRGTIELELTRISPASQAGGLQVSATRQPETAGEFDPLEGAALVWRGDAAQPGLRGLRLDLEHPLVHLYQGLCGFEELYKGGGPETFRGTIAHLEAALERRANDAVTPGILARTYLYQARTYDLHQVLPQAEALSRRAVEVSGARPFYLWSTTVGQIRLLRGDGAGALESFAAAERAGPPDSCDGHNVQLGFGRAYASLGRSAEAEASLLRAHDSCRGDPHTLLALAELYGSGDPARGRQHARQAWEQRGGVRYARSGTGIGAAALAVARCELAQGNLEAAHSWLRVLANQAIRSPRDFGQACRLALALPDEALTSALREDLESTLQVLVQYLEWVASPLGAPDSAISWSGIGAGRLRLGRPDSAVEALERARRARDLWPSDVRAAHWADDACDLYALALARHERARPDPSEQELRPQEVSTACFDQAELLVQAHEPPWEEADLLLRLRARARQVLGRP